MASILIKFEQYFQFRTPLIWKNIFFIAVFHIIFLYSFTLIPTAKVVSLLWLYFCGMVADIAISGGAHRLWTHKSYKAKLPLRFAIMLCYMLGGQYSLVQWARDHRTHHKYTETDADPHNASRGLFFSHCGWLMMKRLPEVKEKGKVIDVSDLWEDPVIRFHQKHFKLLVLVVHVIFPSAVGYFILQETLKNSIFLIFFFRYVLSLNMLWSSNSLAHYWGYKPYNKNIRATDSAFVAFLLLGEGWHNFHHTFPWDYRIGEKGQAFQYTSSVIDVLAWFGLAYERKTASPDLIKKVLAKTDIPANYEAPLTDANYNLIDTKQ